MKIGLLECDHVAESFQHIGGDYRDMFQRLLPGVEFVFYDLCNHHFPNSVEDCDAYVVTGSKYSVYDDIDWIYRLKDLVRDIYHHQKYYIGVCFGHQMLAEALGGKVHKSESGWCVGAHQFQLLHQAPWMHPFKDQLNLLMSCQDQVQQMPENSKLLAQSSDCPVAMFQVGKKMMGIQGHPEFPKAYSRALMDARVERIGLEKVEVGIKSLDLELDDAVFSGWMMAFFTPA
ncbi:MAG: GMP synthase [Saprospiraceae bacterium]|nr:MAG: GMP synthase [Saprospiraceae bacterium]